uniref:ABC transporter domain-containing protein n=2 Tax=Spongospora subterranea TaxID=70186 RepID=A0A0H5QXH3_9EUKA|eukprot:CRZ06316.1 hypothetical protein [Spongospora subterranea]
MLDFGLGILNEQSNGLLSKFMLPSQSYSRQGVIAFNAIKRFSRGSQPATLCTNSPILITKLNFAVASSKQEADDRLYKGWNNNDSFVGGLVINEAGDNRMNYDIVVNKTLTDLQDMPALSGLMSNAIYRMLASRNGSQPITRAAQVQSSGTKMFPSPKTKVEFDLISLIGPSIYIYIFSMLLPVFMYNLVSEKESKIRDSMKMMGLKHNVHFLVTYLFHFTLYIIAMMFLVIIASILGFRYFTQNAFGSYFILLFIWGHVLCASAILLSTFFRTSKTATVIGYLLIFGLGMIASSLITSFFSSSSTSPTTMFFIQLVPNFALYRGLISLRQGVEFGNPGLSMADLSEPDVHLSAVYIYLICEWIVILVLAWSIDGHGNPFTRLQTYALAKRGKGTLPQSDLIVVADNTPDEGQDVIDEAKAALDDSSREPILMRNLRKVYPGYGSGQEKIAVKGLSMRVRFGECLGFLGSNGAGKSTTLSMLCGFVKPTSGSAKIFGKYVGSEMDSIHTILGVCPQENVVWGELSGGEHLEFFGKLKGLTGDELEKAIVNSLRDVELLTVRHKLAMQYSGGMKRRLCVAIAFIGKPSVVLLDEPTTGLDPAARKNLWTVISNYKKSCALMLTTHSMEEAENLCDRVAIFERARLRCIGTCSALKQRFEQGYKLTITSDGQHEQEITKQIMKTSSDAILLNKLCGVVTYEVPSQTARLSVIFRDIESNKKTLGILDWCISNTTLEEVFVRIATGKYESRQSNLNLEK